MWINYQSFFHHRHCFPQLQKGGLQHGGTTVIQLFSMVISKNLIYSIITLPHVIKKCAAVIIIYQHNYDYNGYLKFFLYFPKIDVFCSYLYKWVLVVVPWIVVLGDVSHSFVLVIIVIDFYNIRNVWLLGSRVRFQVTQVIHF